ncbi:hypothetical protein [Vibrio coralliirubri]|uniref:hypothetical protein n=1 Tax=Vibrio coralliirubri TaxID=1516159 RepID=UPI00063366AF|nr:hypothetical protein [Vibrio coralliirubri]CDU15770.1 conserved hypothetical protein [Vibrio coralliirubri]
MNKLAFYDKFPPLPLYKANWCAVQLEPIIGSGERITIAICAIGEDNDFRVVSTLSDDVLSYLYGSQNANMKSLINMTTDTLTRHLNCLKPIVEWRSPIDGVTLGPIQIAVDIDLVGVIEQAVRFSSSLSNLLSEGISSTPENRPKRTNNKFSTSIQREIEQLKPSLIPSFNQRVRVAGSETLTSIGFLNEKYATNFGLLVPNNLSSSLTNIKARIFDIEALKKSDLLFKPDKYEVIIGAPSFTDVTLSDAMIHKLKNSFEMIEEIADKEEIRIFKVDDANKAAQHIVAQAA